MINRIFTLLSGLVLFVTISYSQSTRITAMQENVYQDAPFLQDFSIKYYLQETNTLGEQVFCDRNGIIQIYTPQGPLRTRAGEHLYPGTLVPDRTYRTSAEKKVAGMTLYQNQFVYVDNEAVFSHAWAGKVFDRHSLPNAHLVVGGNDFTFLVSDGTALQLLQNGRSLWTGEVPAGKIQEIKHDPVTDVFWILADHTLRTFSPSKKILEKAFTGTKLTSFTIAKQGKELVIGTTNGYLIIDAQSKKQIGEIHQKLPATNINTISEIDGQLWFGTSMGAFMLRKDGKFNYYYGERWLPDNEVIKIVKGTGGRLVILTNAGLSVLHFEEMTLHDKAMFYDRQVRDRHIRLGFNASLIGMEKGEVTTGFLGDSDNDGLWTSMYLGGEIFRYAVTKSPEALQNCRESLAAMERLYSINPIPGFPSRSFERSGYIDKLSDPDRWQHAKDEEWDWKATTSSDEAIGHIFVFGVMAELMDDDDLKRRAIHLIDILMQHVVDNDFYLIDYDGKPTTWGRWNPEYVNARPKMVGDRKINSSNIIAMLQTAYHFTGKEVYKEKAFELMDDFGYLENLMRPMAEIGEAPSDADDWSKMLSESWNHSDDEMYFLGYWGLYRYAFNDSLKAMYKAAIIDHWEIERPEKEGAWNLFTAITGTESFDLKEAAWYLREYPLDLITWDMKNSHRKDIEKIAPNFRQQSTKEVLPPDELRISRHNANRFTLDGGSGGKSEYSAGDIWILPYWLGRYLGVISPPLEYKK